MCNREGMGLTVAPLHRLIEVWAGASAIVMALVVVERSFYRGIGFLASSYFGGAILSVHIIIGVVLASVVHFGSRAIRFATTRLSKIIQGYWLWASFLGCMFLLGVFSFAMLYTGGFDELPLGFIWYISATLVALRFSWQDKAQVRRYIAVSAFRTKYLGYQSLCFYLVAWGISVSLSVIASSLVVLPSYTEYNRVLWLFETVLTLVFSVFFGLIFGYLFFSLDSHTAWALDVVTISSRRRTIYWFSALMHIGFGALVLAYVYSASMLPLDAVLGFGLGLSSVTWLATFLWRRKVSIKLAEVPKVGVLDAE
jgi:hypothetical protein